MLRRREEGETRKAAAGYLSYVLFDLEEEGRFVGNQRIIDGKHMTELQEIQRSAGESKLEFLLIGGLAVIEHGFARVTTDIDLLVRMRDRQLWKKLLEGLGYQIINEQDAFQQYERSGMVSWPIDLMFVNEATYDGMSTNARQVEVMGAFLRMVSLSHLLALKLHVLKQGRMSRFLDDFTDVIELVKSNSLDLKSSEMRDLFLKYGNADLYEKVQRIANAS